MQRSKHVTKLLILFPNYRRFFLLQVKQPQNRCFKLVFPTSTTIVLEMINPCSRFRPTAVRRPNLHHPTLQHYSATSNGVPLINKIHSREPFVIPKPGDGDRFYLAASVGSRTARIVYRHNSPRNTRQTADHVTTTRRSRDKSKAAVDGERTTTSMTAAKRANVRRRYLLARLRPEGKRVRCIKRYPELTTRNYFV